MYSNITIQELLKNSKVEKLRTKGIDIKLAESQQSNLKESSNTEHNEVSLFEVEKANDVIHEALNQPDPLYLFPELILENSFNILFADTGVGKTILSFQMAIHIALAGYATIYLDLELSKKQFQKRYVNENGVPFKLPNNLYRIGFSSLKKVPKNISYEDFFFRSLIKAIKLTNAKVIILDNLTKLAAGDTDSAKTSIPLLERLNDLKTNGKLTILVLEHNKKVDNTRPININDLQGSKMKSNLVDSVLSIGKSVKDTKLRYIKQVKVRDGEMIYDENNVKVCEISRSRGYLAFNDVGVSSEYEHLSMPSKKDKQAEVLKVKEKEIMTV